MNTLAPASGPFGPIEPNLGKRLKWCAQIWREDAKRYTEPDRIAWRLRRAERLEQLAREAGKEV
jgi:hypothetical protein